MNIKEALDTAYAHVNAVSVCGEKNMRHQLAAMDYINAVRNALKDAQREDTANEGNPNEERADA